MLNYVKFGKKLKVDVCYALSGLRAERLSASMSWIQGIPFVLRLRGDPFKERHISLSNNPITVLFDLFEGIIIKSADVIIPISENLKKLAIALGIDQKRITDPIPTGIDIKLFSPKHRPPGEKFTIGYAGRYAPIKGVSILIKIIEALPDVDFLIAGFDNFKRYLPNNAKCLGWIPLHDMPDFYNNIDALILPSLSEGSPLVCLEAYACGKPVIANYNVITPEFPKHGCFPRTYSVDAYVNAIMNVKDNDFEYSIRNIRCVIVKKHSLETYSKKLLNIFKRIT